MGKITLDYGFNWDAFTDSNIAMHGTGYDLVFHNVHARDRPGVSSPIELVNSVAQYSARLGYDIDDKWGVSLGIDHMKYVAVDGQHVRMSGRIGDQRFNRTPVRLNDYVQGFEHTNGLNLVDVEFAYNQQVVAKDWFRLSARVGGGLGVVIPKSDVTLFGKRLDNVFHVAGAGMSAALGLRAELSRYFYVDARMKGGAIALPHVLTVGDGRASHAFGFIEAILSAGVAIPL